MAPTQKKRTSARERASKATKASKPTPSSHAAATDAALTPNKKDKRIMKHSLLLSKIEKNRPGAKKRGRRPNRSLLANLDSLADALPVDDDDGNGDGTAAAKPILEQVQFRQQKSLKSRPGAMKRKERLERMERDRFGKNLAQMMTNVGREQPAPAEAQPSSSSTSAPTGVADRWAALRAFVGSTMERRPEFAQS